MTTTETKMTPNELQLAEGPESYLTADLSSKSTQQAAGATSPTGLVVEDGLDFVRITLPSWLTEEERERIAAAGARRFHESVERALAARSDEAPEPAEHMPGECPAWCEVDSRDSEGTIHTATVHDDGEQWVVEYGFEDDHAANSRRPWVYANITNLSDELTPAEALAMGKALIRAAEQLGATS